MTFSMSELNRTTRVEVEEEEDENAGLSIREIEEQKKKEKEAEQRKDDIALGIAMLTLLIITSTIVVLKVTIIDEKPDPNISTFKPLPQQINSNIKYTDNGYLPCNGYVPCQPAHLSPKELADRMQDAGPCHDYLGKGAGPEGCW